jgi:hypothetical protein
MRFLGAMFLLALVAIAFSFYSDIASDPLQARIIFCGGHTNVAIAGVSVTRDGPIGMTLIKGVGIWLRFVKSRRRLVDRVD